MSIASKVWVCLCRPSDVRNIGGALRAVANFGLAGVKLICSEVNQYDEDELSACSSGALRHVPFLEYTSLSEALSEADLIIGTSRRHRAHTHLHEVVSSQLPEYIRTSLSPHLLFGNERAGLSHAELDLCHLLTEIHSTPEFPSLNLAHAVACIAYELARPISESDLIYRHDIHLPQVVDPVADEAFLHRVIEVSTLVGYPPSKSPERFARQLRSLMRRAAAEPGDYGLILGLMREIHRLYEASNTSVNIPTRVQKRPDE